MVIKYNVTGAERKRLVAALCDRCQRQTKFYYPEDAQDLIKEIQGWKDERNDDEI